MRVKISLDPDTLDLTDKPALLISFHPDDNSQFYTMIDGRFALESVMKIDNDILSIIATVEGVLTGQMSKVIAHYPDDMLQFEARFDLQRVVNRSRWDFLDIERHDQLGAFVRGSDPGPSAVSHLQSGSETVCPVSRALELSLRSIRIARHSRVYSSITLSMRNFLPSWVRPSTKS